MSEVDGWITIGTRLDTEDLNKKYRKLVSELKSKQQEAEKLTKIKVRLETDMQEYEEKKRMLEEFTNESLAKTLSDKEAEVVLENEARQLRDLNEEYSVQFEQIEEINNKISANVGEQELLKDRIEETNQALQKTKYLTDIKKSINDVGKSIQRATKRVVHWGLAIFGVRSAYLFVRQAMSTLSQYNEDLANNLQYIRFALASAIEPLVIKIVEWAYKLLSIVFTIIKLLTGYDLFKNTGVDKYQKAMEKGSKSLASGAKSAKEIHKQLAGFDEMNVLSDNTSGGAGADSGAGTGVGLPTLELKEVKLPQWMEDLLAHGEELLALILGIVGALKLLSLGMAPLKALGIGVAIAGIVYAVEGLLKYLKNPTWENFGQIIQGIGIAVIGLGIAFLGLPAIITGVVVLILGIIASHWEQVKELFDKAIGWLTQKMNEVKEKYGYFAGLIVQSIRDQVVLIKNHLNTILTKAKDILDNIIQFFKNVFAGNWKGAWQNIKNIALNVFDVFVANIKLKLGTIKNIIVGAFGVIGDIIGGILKGTINAVLSYIESKINTAIGMFNGVLSLVNKLPGVSINKVGTVRLPRLAKGGIVNLPNRGVPIGGAIAGERGQEGVIPLTDSQQMALLGEAIGKYITINATVVNSMNGRIISREIQKVQNQNNFALNR